MHSVHTTNQFLSIFNKIDKFFSEQLRAKRYIPYSEKVDLMIQKGLPGAYVVDQYQSKFLYFGELRNQLVHGFSLDQKHLVVVSDYAVRQITTLYEGLTTPKTAGEVFTSEVYTCQVRDSLASVITIMRDQLNTHVPVYDGDQFVEMLSESTIAYWLADQIQTGSTISLENLRVGDIALENSNDTFEFISISESMYDIRDRFLDELADKKRLGAVFLTQTGRSDEAIEGIVTAMDFHSLVQAGNLLLDTK